MSASLFDRVAPAQKLVKEGRYDEAAAEFAWLWDNIEPEDNGPRVSLLARYIKELVGKHPPARQRFSEIRDRTATLAGADVASTERLRFDWIVLNEILSEPERTLAWLDSVKDDERHATVLEWVGPRLIPLLKEHSRFRDIGRIYKDPVTRFVKTHRAFQPPPDIAADPYPDPNPDLTPDVQRLIRHALQTVLDSLPRHVIEEAALMVTSLLAAGRTADAVAVEREARRLDPSEAMRAALEKARGRLD